MHMKHCFHHYGIKHGGLVGLFGSGFQMAKDTKAILKKFILHREKKRKMC